MTEGYEWRDGAARPVPEDYVAPTKKPPYIVFENQFMCTRCGAGVISRKIHTKWHKNLNGKIQVAANTPGGIGYYGGS